MNLRRETTFSFSKPFLLARELRVLARLSQKPFARALATKLSPGETEAAICATEHHDAGVTKTPRNTSLRENLA
jgi:hypothetical protein